MDTTFEETSSSNRTLPNFSLFVILWNILQIPFHKRISINEGKESKRIGPIIKRQIHYHQYQEVITLTINVLNMSEVGGIFYLFKNKQDFHG